jgi:hypothetical protein
MKMAAITGHFHLHDYNIFLVLQSREQEAERSQAILPVLIPAQEAAHPTSTQAVMLY